MMMYRGGPSLRLRPKALAAGSTIILRGLILQKQRIRVGTGHSDKGCTIGGSERMKVARVLHLATAEVGKEGPP